MIRKLLNNDIILNICVIILDILILIAVMTFIYLLIYGDKYIDKIQNDRNIYKPNFNNSIEYILKNEGGLVDDKDDSGGITNYGLSLRYLKNLINKKPELKSFYDLNKDNKINADDIKLFNKNDAIKIYKEEWWNKYNYEKINYHPLATKIFDFSIHMGPTKAIKLLQKSCLKINPNSKLIIDGILNDETVNFINNLTISEKKLLTMTLSFMAIKFYLKLVKQNPKYNKYIKGWVKRAIDIEGLFFYKKVLMYNGHH